MAVWTINNFGQRVSGTVLKTTKTLVPSTHRMIHIVLDDGSELFVSPGHPTADGRTAGELSAGDSLNGGRVLNAQRITYQKNYTYDILPSGETGLYWANGILMASTLFHSK